MNGYPLIETIIVVLLVGSSIFYVARASWRGVKAAGAARASGCGGCNGCGKRKAPALHNLDP